jgi:hypothetical protein
MNLDKLQVQLLNSGLQQKDPVLYQIINQLIKFVRNFNNNVVSGGISGGDSDATYLTVNNELTNLPNSRRVEAGDGIELDDSVVGVRTINNLLALLTILTEQDETAELPNSFKLVAGNNITFDTSVPSELEINADNPTFVEWSVLTNGDVTNPELIFADGDVIMVHIP